MKTHIRYRIDRRTHVEIDFAMGITQIGIAPLSILGTRLQSRRKNRLFIAPPPLVGAASSRKIFEIDRGTVRSL